MKTTHTSDISMLILMTSGMEYSESNSEVSLLSCLISFIFLRSELPEFENPDLWRKGKCNKIEPLFENITQIEAYNDMRRKYIIHRKKT
ncbi:hypothetical protein DLD82_06235 [Methanospirillum stamsii]|uniref:Uncharacterized protein n=1 Tax=Methanospirillum stamsii TaxID=1277351 RepID=A0A2V2NFL1_9EURY|nr:hypothetical protein DLD82_06235 [Methanospirillum stamsii]